MRQWLCFRAGWGGTAWLVRCGLCVALVCGVGVTEAQSVRTVIGQGREHLAAGRLAAAESAFVQATRLDSSNVEAWNGLGAVLNRLDRFAEAFEAQERAVRFDPRHVGLRFNRGLVALELGRFQLALDDFDWVLLERPTFAPALTERGTALAALGGRDAAIAQWDLALAADSTYVWPRYYRALQAIADADFARAAGDLDVVLAAHPEHAYAHLWRWVAYRRAGRPARPLPAERGMWPGAIAEYLDGRIAAAALEERAHAERLALDDRRLASARYFMAQRQLAEGDTATARRSLERALGLETPTHAEVVAAKAERERLRQASQQASRGLLRALFAPLVGMAMVEVVDQDSAGREEYRATQSREFTYTVGGGYVREVLLNESNPRREGGMLLHGVSGDSIRTFGFWGADADGLFITWTFASPSRLIGVGTERVDGIATPMRSEMVWANDTMIWRTWVHPAGGSEYLDHTLTYRRAQPG